MSSLSVTMSPGSRKKKHAVSSASAEAAASHGGGADDGPPTKHKRMRLDDDDRKPSADPHADLNMALQRKAQVLANLEAARERHR